MKRQGSKEDGEGERERERERERESARLMFLVILVVFSYLKGKGFFVNWIQLALFDGCFITCNFTSC